MSKTLEFFFDFGSPTTYLAWTQLPKLCAEHEATLVYKPLLLGGVFKAAGNSSPVMVPAKANYMLVELARFAKRYGVELAFNPHFPINTLQLMRMAAGLQLQSEQALTDFMDAIFPAMWCEGKNMGDIEVVKAVLSEAGLDSDAIIALAADEDAKAALKATTEDAVARGAFGAPTCFIGEDMYFGQDRLDFIAEHLSG